MSLSTHVSPLSSTLEIQWQIQCITGILSRVIYIRCPRETMLHSIRIFLSLMVPRFEQNMHNMDGTKIFWHPKEIQYEKTKYISARNVSCRSSYLKNNIHQIKRTWQCHISSIFFKKWVIRTKSSFVQTFPNGS